MRLLQKFPGVLIVVSHDIELLRTRINALWHIDQGKVTVFSGNYEDYRQETSKKRKAIEDELRLLDRQKKQTHKDLMKEQTRAKKSKMRGKKKREQGRWPTLIAGGKEGQAQETTGRHNSYIHNKKQALIEKLDGLRLPEIMNPKFFLQASDINSSRPIISIINGCCGYGVPLLEGVFLSVPACSRLAITGDNGSGKTTFVKAILNESDVIKTGDWIVPKPEDIGYLDQHYSTLAPQRSVLETIQAVAPAWSHEEMRRHLNDFLFRKNEEVAVLVSTLSGGEKARLSLAQIAAKTPKLLILDEMSNNLDLETRNHMIQTLKNYCSVIHRI
jgi:ATPase subunit of ABC transporter with duplicated ATPase domains